MSNKPTVQILVAKPTTEIVALLGSVYEHSPWVVQELVATTTYKSFTKISQLARAMKDIVDAASDERKQKLLLSHPDLCKKVGKLSQLTPESREEQGRSGLQSLTEAELQEFTALNTAYRRKCGFPFILAVRNATKHTVLAALRGRLWHTPLAERVTALQQVHKIAWMRLLSKIDTSDATGFLTCHVLDTANGCPGTYALCVVGPRRLSLSRCDCLLMCHHSLSFSVAANMRIQLHHIVSPTQRTLIGEFVTNDDGRLPGGPALPRGSVGEYEWTFYVGDYFAAVGTYTAGTPFLSTVPIRFGMDNPDEHYHVPLLVSPWSFSTYRGS